MQLTHKWCVALLLLLLCSPLVAFDTPKLKIRGPREGVTAGRTKAIKIEDPKFLTASKATIVADTVPFSVGMEVPAVMGDPTKVDNYIVVRVGAALTVPQGVYSIQLFDNSNKMLGEFPIRVLAPVNESDGAIHCFGSPDFDPALTIGKKARCELSIMSPKETSDIFGGRIRKRYYAIQVNVTNEDPVHEYLIRDIVMKYSDDTHSSTLVLALAQGVAEKGQALDKRNLGLRTLESIGGILGGLTVFSFATVDFKNALNVFQGPALAGYRQTFPDFTVGQINRLNAAAFDDRKTTVVPKAGAGGHPSIIVALLPHDGEMDLPDKSSLHIEVVGSFIQAVEDSTFTLSTTSVQFGPTALGNKGESKTIVLTNVSAAPLQITAVAPAADFSMNADVCSKPVSPGASCQLEVGFVPRTSGSRSGTITLKDNQRNFKQDVALSGNGLEPLMVNGAFEWSVAETHSVILSSPLSSGSPVSNIEIVEQNPANSFVAANTTPCKRLISLASPCIFDIQVGAIQKASAKLRITSVASNSPMEVTLNAGK